MEAEDSPHTKRRRESSRGEDEPRTKQTNSNENRMSIYHCNPNELSEIQTKGQTGVMQTTVILATARVKLQYGTSVSEPIRALMDSGGQISLITQKLAKKLKLKTFSCHVPLKGVDGPAGVLSKVVRVALRPWFQSDFVFPVDLYVSERWESVQPHTEIRKEQPPYDHRLADEEYHMPAPVELLLGAEVWAAVAGSTVYKNERGAMMQNSSIGCLALGRFVLRDDDAVNINVLNVHADHEGEAGISNKLLADALKHYRDKQGRYVVFIPLKADHTLGDSRTIALRRFHQLERRLQRNPALREAYTRLIREEQQADYMRQADKPPGKMAYYIPHHPVLGKLRIVDDASCKTTNGRSLNDVQLTGPKLQYDLSDQIMRFRRHKIAFIADIRKMFKQVRVDPSQWDLMRIFWRDDPKEPLREYWLTTVIFGMSSSVFNACRAMIQCGRDNAQRFPDAAKEIENNFYMDDYLSGASTLEEAKLLCRETALVLSLGGFELRNWNSNHAEIERTMRSSNQNEIVEIDADGPTKLLGVNWNKKTDELAIRVNMKAGQKADTKRKILSEIARVYDPNGFIAPVVVKAKSLMQDIWREKDIGWDDSLKNTRLLEKWQSYYEKLPCLKDFRIPRWLSIDNQSQIELHGFADACTTAYGCLIYTRTVTNCCVKVSLLVAKSKVAPLNTQSIPRLELQAAVMLSKLMQQAKKMLEMPDVKYYCWSDSTIVLHWLKKSPHELKTFVQNRVKVILENTSVRSWAHIDTKQNPADLVSRGLNADELLKSKLWLNGPDWLAEDRSKWPISKLSLSPEAESAAKKEIKPMEIFEMMSFAPFENDKGSLLNRYSSWQKILRVTAIVLRFIYNARRKKHKRRTGRALTIADTSDAVNFWATIVQGREYHREIECIKAKDKQLPDNSKLTSLRPFLDRNGVLRVGCRIGNAPIEFGRKHPIIIPPKTRVAYLILRQTHLDDNHSGIQAMMAAIRNEYWIPRLRLECRKYISTCGRCVRYKKRVEDQIMGELPEVRVKPARPFRRSGVDMAGPFMVKMMNGRTYNTRSKKWSGSNQMLKGYIAVFVCLVTRAVHLEPVMGMTADAFKAAFLRFTARRGHCELMLSDNGTNFVGANHEFAEAYESWRSDELQYMINLEHTVWKFITPSAPHEGGLWEAAVKAMKTHLRRVIGTQKYTFEGMATLLAGVEACLNSRPLSAMSDDPNDMETLTPAHFLIGGPLKLPLPEQASQQSTAAGKKLFNEMQAQQVDFWKAWSADYLSSLMQTPKWQRIRENLKAGQMVLIQADNYAPTYWQLGRVIKVHPGSDGLVRSATIRVANGQLDRSIRKLCVLTTEEDILDHWKD